MSSNDSGRDRSARFIEDEVKPAEKNEASATIEESAEAKSSGNTEEFEYVVPTKRKHRHKHRRHHHHSEKKSSQGSQENATDDFVFPTGKKRKHKKHRRHKKRMPTWLRVLLIILGVILGIMLILAITFFILRGIGRSSMHDYKNIDVVIPMTDEQGENVAGVEDKGRTITYDGKTYKLNENVMSITFIGYNEKDPNRLSDRFMGDAIYIVAIDDKTGKTTILGVSRDTMLDVNVYSSEGKFIDTEKLQLAYAYSYGNDEVSGGENTNTSLTRLFFGLPFNDYFAIDLASLQFLNDAIGGVTLTSQLTFDSEYYGRTIEEGEVITLHGNDVETYVRRRDMTYVEANNVRMDRQQQYIKAFLQSIIPAAKKDLSHMIDLFNVVNENADSTLNLPKVTYLASTALSKLRNSDDIEYIRLSGEMKLNGNHAEMYLDDKDVLETMLKIFYTQVD